MVRESIQRGPHLVEPLARRSAGGSAAPGVGGRAGARFVPGRRARGTGPATGLLDRPISVSATLSLAGILLVLLITTKGAADLFGGGGVITASAVGGFADAHSSALAAASVAGDEITVDTATVTAVVAVGTNLITKLVLAAVAGSVRFAATLAAWLAPPVAVTAATVWVVLVR